MALYSDKVMDHFQNPRNVGKIEDADGIGEVGNAKCGDIMRMYIKVSDGVITDCKFKRRWSFRTRRSSRRSTGCPPISCTAQCWPRRPSRPLSKTITIKTASPMTPRCSKISRTASTATNKNDKKTSPTGEAFFAADCSSLRSLHKFGLAKNAALRLCFWSLTYRTAASPRAHALPKAKATRWVAFAFGGRYKTASRFAHVHKKLCCPPSYKRQSDNHPGRLPLYTFFSRLSHDNR